MIQALNLAANQATARVCQREIIVMKGQVNVCRSDRPSHTNPTSLSDATPPLGRNLIGHAAPTLRKASLLALAGAAVVLLGCQQDRGGMAPGDLEPSASSQQGETSDDTSPDGGPSGATGSEAESADEGEAGATGSGTTGTGTTGGTTGTTGTTGGGTTGSGASGSGTSGTGSSGGGAGSSGSSGGSGSTN
jgi:hypothetical protein